MPSMAGRGTRTPFLSTTPSTVRHRAICRSASTGVTVMRDDQNSLPWGPSLSIERAVLTGDLVTGPGWLWCWVSSQLLVPCRRAAVGQAQRPEPLAPVGARARANELDARERWPMIASEESLLGLWLAVGGSLGCWLPGVGA